MARWTPGQARGDGVDGATRRYHRTPGFTLIELLVGLALLGLLAAMLLSVVESAGIIARRERGGSAAMDETVGAQRALRAAIERLRPVTRRDSALPIVDLRGSAEQLDFLGPPLASAGPDALQRYRVMRSAAGELMLYHLSSRSNQAASGPTDLTGWTGVPLLEGVIGLSIDYLGPTATDRHQAWRTRWFDQPQTPELIRVRLRFAAGDARVWPDLVVRPRATLNAACPVDPLTGACAEPRDS